MSLTKSFVKSLDGAKPSLANTTVFNARTLAVKEANIGISAIDRAMKKIEFKYVNGSAVVNSSPWRTYVPDMRTGKIRKAFDKMKVTTDIKPRDEAAFKKLLSNDLPDIKVDLMETNIAAAKPSNPGLDIPPAKDGAALKESLSPSDQMKVEITMEKFKKYATGGVVAGVIGVILYGGISLYEDLNRAAKERNGCFIVEYALGTTKGCKINPRSCDLQEGSNSCQNNKINANIYTFMYDVVDRNDTQLMAKIKAECGIELSDKSSVVAVLNSSDKTITMVEWYKKNITPDAEIYNPCDVAKKVNNNVDIKGCIACDSSQPPNSSRYVDDSDLATNLQIKCITNSTILDALVDVATGLGITIFERVSDSATSASGSLSNQWFVYIIVIVLIVIISFSVYLQFFKKSKNQGRVIQPPPSQYQQQTQQGYTGSRYYTPQQQFEAQERLRTGQMMQYTGTAAPLI